MIFGIRHPVILILLTMFLAGGCSSPGTESPGKAQAWMPGEDPSPKIPPPITGRDLIDPDDQSIISDADFARELSALFARASAEIAKLSTEAGIAADFPDDASRMLENSALLLNSIAQEGYQSFDEELTTAYGKYVDSTSGLQGNIELAEGLIDLPEDETVEDKDLISSDILAMKRNRRKEELEKLKGELAAERSRFAFARESLFVAHSAGIEAEQRERITMLEDQLGVLADDYATRVSIAIDEAIADTSIGIRYRMLTGVDIHNQVEEFHSDFERGHEKAKAISGESG